MKSLYFFKNPVIWLGLAFLYGLLLSLPDVLIWFRGGEFPVFNYYKRTILFSFFSPFLWQYFIGRMVLAVFLLISFSAGIFRDYFGVFYSPPDVWALFIEFRDVVLGMADLPKEAILTICFLLISLVLIFRVKPKFFESRWLVILFLLFSSYVYLRPLIKINKTTLHYVYRYFPDNRYPAFYAGYNSFFWSIQRYIPSKLQSNKNLKVNYSPYVSIDNGGKSIKPSVIILLGESINPDRMGVFGHGRPTTPGLERLLRENNGISSLMMSSSTVTRVSVPMFINVVREPDNYNLYRSKTFNLFGLAKQRGYKTYFISSQEMDGFSNQIGLQNIDLWRDSFTDDGFSLDDNGLADFSEKVFRGQVTPIFAIVNTRVAHAPYISYVPQKFRKFSKEAGLSGLEIRQAEYDDAVTHFDRIATKVLRQILDAIDGPIVVFLISDHGERLGEDGSGFGHGVLSLKVGKTPFLHFTRGYPRYLGRNINCPRTHYDLGIFIGSILGFDLKNPNDTGSRFLNGGDISGDGGFLEFDPQNIEFLKKTCFEYEKQ